MQRQCMGSLECMRWREKGEQGAVVRRAWGQKTTRYAVGRRERGKASVKSGFRM